MSCGQMDESWRNVDARWICCGCDVDAEWMNGRQNGHEWADGQGVNGLWDTSGRMKMEHRTEDDD